MSTMDNNVNEPRQSAGPPFDSSEVKRGADFVIQSSDNVDFYVHKHMLTFGSPESYFTNIFTDVLPGVPQSEGGFALPMVKLEESSQVLSLLFTLCHPFEDCPFTVDQIALVAAAAKKYVMDGPLRKLEHVVCRSGVIQKYPVMMYCLGVDYQWPQVVTKAARASLSFHFESLTVYRYKELSLISATDLGKLLHYYISCRDKLKGSFHAFLGFDGEYELHQLCAVYHGAYADEFAEVSGGCHCKNHSAWISREHDRESETDMEVQVHQWVGKVLDEMERVLTLTPEPSSIIRPEEWAAYMKAVEDSHCSNPDEERKNATRMILTYVDHLESLIGEVGLPP